MKHLIIYILTFLLISPPLLAHNDVIIYEDDIEQHIDVDHEHEEEHHQNDNDEDKNKEHHHHCSIEFSSILAISFPLNQLQIVVASSEKTLISFYQSIYNSSYLDGIFQPPRV